VERPEEPQKGKSAPPASIVTAATDPLSKKVQSSANSKQVKMDTFSFK
jgi:hypothetical protein